MPTPTNIVWSLESVNFPSDLKVGFKFAQLKLCRDNIFSLIRLSINNILGLLSGKTILVFKAINSTVQNTIISFPKEHQKVFSFKSCRVYKKRWQWSGLILSYATISESLIFQEMNWLANSLSNWVFTIMEPVTCLCLCLCLQSRFCNISGSRCVLRTY